MPTGNTTSSISTFHSYVMLPMPCTTYTSTAPPSFIVTSALQTSSSKPYLMVATELKCPILAQPTWQSRARQQELGPSCTVPLRCSPVKMSQSLLSPRPRKWMSSATGSSCWRWLCEKCRPLSLATPYYRGSRLSGTFFMNSSFAA